jgi:predicted metal-binding membrane protein
VSLAQAFSEIRARLLLVLLLVLAATAWWWSARRMAGMDAGPGTDLGALGWFEGIWVVMMAAMMLPSLTPTVGLFARMSRRGIGRPILFTGGYVVVWGAAGLAAYAAFVLGQQALGSQFAWARGGRWLAGGVLALAAVYELTPLKNVCLSKCRSPLGFLIGSWRDGPGGALEMGARHAAWCLGCCWALMAALFALGIMSLTWMAFVAGLITVEKMLPWRRVATYGTALILLVLAVLVAALPQDVPGLVIPHAQSGMMQSMGAMR